MVDPLTVLAAGGTVAYFFKDQFDKILGPTSDYLGEKTQSFVKQRVENVNKIMLKTERTLGEKINEPGSVSPRIVERLINSGSFIEDDLTQEYFAGVMATSRTKDGKDDRGLYFLDLIGKLSHADLKVHYIFYSQLRKKHLGTKASIFIVDDRHLLYNRMNVNEFFTEFQNYYHDTCDRELILTEAASRLLKEDLLNEIVFGPKEFIEKRVKALFGYKHRDVDKLLEDSQEDFLQGLGLTTTRDLWTKLSDKKSDQYTTIYESHETAFLGGRKKIILTGNAAWEKLSFFDRHSHNIIPEGIDLIYTPSPLGAQLFLWAHGEGQRLANDIFDPDLVLEQKPIKK